MPGQARRSRSFSASGPRRLKLVVHEQLLGIWGQGWSACLFIILRQGVAQLIPRAPIVPFSPVEMKQPEPPAIRGASSGRPEGLPGPPRACRSSVKAERESHQTNGGARERVRGGEGARASCTAGPPEGVLVGPSWPPRRPLGLSRGIVGQSWNSVARRGDFGQSGDILEAVVGRVGALGFLEIARVYPRTPGTVNYAFPKEYFEIPNSGF